MYPSRAVSLALALVGLFTATHNGQEIAEVATEGSYNLELHTAKGSDYQNFYSTADYPLHIFLKSKIYSEINVPSLTSNVVVLLDRLFATPTNNRNDPEAVNLVLNRCAVDQSIAFISSPNDKFRFSFDMFAFTTNLERVYLHADTFLCHQSSSDVRCSDGCQGNQLSRSRRSVDEEYPVTDVPVQNFELMMGPFIKADLIAAHPADVNSVHRSSDNGDIVLLISGFLIVVIIVIAFLYVECRVSKLRGKFSINGHSKKAFDVDEFTTITQEAFEN